jgi:hypothetical protein
LDDRKRFAVSECRERPDVGSRRLIANVVVNDISAIRRPPVGLFITFTAEQQLFAAAPTHRLDVNVFLGATTRRTKWTLPHPQMTEGPPQKSVSLAVGLLESEADYFCGVLGQSQFAGFLQGEPANFIGVIGRSGFSPHPAA